MKQYNFKLVYKKFNRKANIIKNCVILFFLLLFAVLTIFYAMGKLQIMYVASGSSAPYHPKGSLAIDYKVDFDKLKVGDFITWSNDGGKMFVTHQIVRVDKVNRTVTCSQQQTDSQGNILPMDEWNEENFDGVHTEDQYYGKVLFSIPKLGLYLTGIKDLVLYNNKLNILGIVSIVLAYFVYYFFSKFLYTPTYVLWENKNWQKQKI